jgi:hypothetical protein
VPFSVFQSETSYRIRSHNSAVGQPPATPILKAREQAAEKRAEATSEALPNV